MLPLRRRVGEVCSGFMLEVESWRFVDASERARRGRPGVDVDVDVDVMAAVLEEVVLVLVLVVLACGVLWPAVEVELVELVVVVTGWDRRVGGMLKACAIM